MARTTTRQRADRVLRLLLGLRDQHTAAAMVRVGFHDADLREGWELLRRTTRERVDPAALPDPAAERRQRERRAEPEAWVDRWLPVLKATLERHAPAMASGVLREAERARGRSREPDPGTGALLVMLPLLPALSQIFETGGQNAARKRALAELLARRGLTEDVVAEGKAILSRQQQPAVRAGRRPRNLDELRGPEPEEIEQKRLAGADRELWAYYLEWSRLARAGIRDRRILRLLGVLRSRASDEAAPVEPPTEPSNTPATRKTKRKRRVPARRGSARSPE